VAEAPEAAALACSAGVSKAVIACLLGFYRSAPVAGQLVRIDLDAERSALAPRTDRMADIHI
jgi:hypothetical protein